MIVGKPQAAVPPGTHQGQITQAIETRRTFAEGAEPENTVEITLQPNFKVPAGTEVLPVVVNFSPVLNGLSALSKLLTRLNIPAPKAGTDFDVESLVGLNVEFTCDINQKGFVRVKKESIVLA